MCDGSVTTDNMTKPLALRSQMRDFMNNEQEPRKPRINRHHSRTTSSQHLSRTVERCGELAQRTNKALVSLDRDGGSTITVDESCFRFWIPWFPDNNDYAISSDPGEGPGASHWRDTSPAQAERAPTDCKSEHGMRVRGGERESHGKGEEVRQSHRSRRGQVV